MRTQTSSCQVPAVHVFIGFEGKKEEEKEGGGKVGLENSTTKKTWLICGDGG